MSYSRWIQSVWYTFPRVLPEGTEDVIDNQIFSVCAVKDFTYKELKTDLEACIQAVYNHCSDEGNWNPSEKELNELRGYIRFFMNDTEEEYLEKKNVS